jgi:hypothetical protein
VKGRWTGRVALTVTGAAILLLAWWLRNPIIPYGGDTSRASQISAESREADDAARTRSEAVSAASAAVRDAERRLNEIARAALDAPAVPEAAFSYLRDLTEAHETGVLVEDGEVPLAWAGQTRLMPSDAIPGTFAVFSPFYTTLEVVVVKGQRRAIATALIHAEPPSE